MQHEHNNVNNHLMDSRGQTAVKLHYIGRVIDLTEM